VQSNRIIAYRIRALRCRYGLTQAALAARAELSEVTISSIERGIWQPRLATVAAIAKALGVSLDELVGWNRPDDGRSRRRSALLLQLETDLAALTDADLAVLAATAAALRKHRTR